MAIYPITGGNKHIPLAHLSGIYGNTRYLGSIHWREYREAIQQTI